MSNAGKQHDSRCMFYGVDGFPRADCRVCELYDVILILQRECRMNKDIIQNAEKTIRGLEAEIDRLERMGHRGI